MRRVTKNIVMNYLYDCNNYKVVKNMDKGIIYLILLKIFSFQNIIIEMRKIVKVMFALFVDLLINQYLHSYQF